MKNDKPLNYTDCVKLTLFVVALAIMAVAFLIIRTIIEFHALHSLYHDCHHIDNLVYDAICTSVI